MQTFALNPRGFQDFVVSLSEVHRAGEVTAVVAHEGACFRRSRILGVKFLIASIAASLSSMSRLLAELFNLPTFTSLPCSAATPVRLETSFAPRCRCITLFSKSTSLLSNPRSSPVCNLVFSMRMYADACW